MVIVLGVLGMVAACPRSRRPSERLGYGGIALGVAGMAGGYAATQSGDDEPQGASWSGARWWPRRCATRRRCIFGALGGLFSERSGVINIALEGMMLIGAFFGAWGADVTSSWILGIVIAIASGAVFGALHALFAVTFRADQIVSGTALNLLAVGITGYLFVEIYGDLGTPDDLPQVPERVRCRSTGSRCSGTCSGNSTCSSGSRSRW